jgi:hypothetical protein
VNSNSGPFEIILARLDAWTKEGRRFAVLRELEVALRDRPDRRYLPALARLANRNHAYVLALRILHGVIRDDREGIARATDDAQTVYATSLLWIGALEEAQERLGRVRISGEAELIWAFVCFAQWDYAGAIPHLIRYVNSKNVADYQKLVGQVNLLASLIALGRLGPAWELLECLKPELGGLASRVLYGNTLELEAQAHLFEGRLESAEQALQQAEVALSDQPGRYLLYVRKWKAVLSLARDHRSQAARAHLGEVKVQALELRNWETIRDCDFHLARLTGDDTLLRRVLLGTPYSGFRERVRSLFGFKLPESRRLEYCPGEVSRPPEQIGLDLEAAEWGALFNPTSWPLVQLMTKDIYRPPQVGVVFSTLHPGESFNPFVSPQRVRNSVLRFNQGARSHPFRIVIRHGDYFLTGPPGASVARTARQRLQPDWEAALRLFRKQNGPRSFTAADLAQALGITPRSALGILSEALQHRKVERIGRGRNTRYILFSGRRVRKAA